MFGKLHSDLSSQYILSSALRGKVQHSLSITCHTAPLSLVLTSPSKGLGFCPDERLNSRWKRRRPVVSRWRPSCWVCGRRTCRWGWTSSEEALTAAGTWAAGWWWSGCHPEERWGGRGNEQEVWGAGTQSGVSCLARTASQHCPYIIIIYCYWSDNNIVSLLLWWSLLSLLIDVACISFDMNRYQSIYCFVFKG